VLDGPVTPLHQLNSKVDKALSDLVARAMARKPGDRFRSARQLSRALRTWISEETNGLGHRSPRRAGSVWTYAAAATLSVGVGVSVWLLTPRGDAVPARTVAAATPAAPPVAAAAVAAMPASAVPAVSAAAATAAPVVEAPAAPVVVAADKPRSPPPRVVKKDKPAPPKAAPAPVAAEPAPVAAQPGVVQLAVVPWGQVEVDGRAMGITPPLSRLTLPAGQHQIVVRNGDFPAYSASVTVSDEKPVTVRHRFE
jgi:eukaryotic-like serine/threonine-protein kinase